VLLSLFWTLNVTSEQAVGPQGSLPAWMPIAAGEQIESAEHNGEPITSVSAYPGGGWQPPAEGDTLVDSFNSAVSNCLTASESALAGMPTAEREVCETAQELMPADTEIPVLEGAAVAVQPKTLDVRLTDDHGVLAAAEVHPVTTDPRVSKDPAGKLLADPFVIVAILDKGSVGLPTYMSLVIFVIFEAFHLWGLNRAEKRKLNPAVV
jgi:hypothetical protein